MGRNTEDSAHQLIATNKETPDPSYPLDGRRVRPDLQTGVFTNFPNSKVLLHGEFRAGEIESPEPTLAVIDSLTSEAGGRIPSRYIRLVSGAPS